MGSPNYRYGFNGKENDNEVKGVGNEIDYGMRYYDPRTGRFMSVDPLTAKYPHYTPYQYAGNTPIWATDVDGLEEAPTTVGTQEGQSQTQTRIRGAARVGIVIDTKIYYWHVGSKAYGTKAGWYDEENYQKVLTPIA